MASPSFELPRARADLPAPARLAAMFTRERDRWTLWLAVAFGGGIALYFALPDEPAPWLGAIVAMAGLIGAAGLRRRPALMLLALALAGAALGLAWSGYRTALIAAPVIGERLGPVGLSGRVVAATPRKAGYRLLLADIESDAFSAATRPMRVRLTVRGRAGNAALERPRPGDRVRLRAILMPPPRPAMPGAFDFARRAYFQQLGAVGIVLGRPAIERLAAADTAATWLARFRDTTTRRILAAVDGTAGAIAAALMTGERGAIPDDVLAAMRDSGLAHLLAISGLHIGLVTGIVFFVLRFALAAIEPLALRFAIKKWAAVGAIFGGFFYLLLSGATVPTQRAFLMTLAVMIAILCDRAPISMRLVAWAAVLVLVLAPEAIFGASFQLSFAAVAALVAVYETMAPRLARLGGAGTGRRLGRYLLAVLLTTAVAGLATLPFAVYHFNRVALYGIVANLAAVPLTGFWIMPWAMLGFVLMPFGLEGWALTPMGWGIDALVGVARRVAGWPGAVALLPAMSGIGLALVAFGGLWLCLWRERWRYLGAPLVIAGLASVMATRPPDLVIDEGGRMYAARLADGELAISSRRKPGFVARTWLRRAGLDQPAPWPRKGLGPRGPLACDRLGCIYRRAGQSVALIASDAAREEDCRRATVLVSRYRIARRACPGVAAIIDGPALRVGGAHALWLDAGGIRIERVEDRRGRRPWSRGGGPAQ
jgi:competence protein ComEC